MVKRWAAKAGGATRSFGTAGASNVGILAMDSYISGRYVDQAKLETADGVSAGKYTVGAWRRAVVRNA